MAAAGMVLAAATALASCGTQPSESTVSESAQLPVRAAAYICPMQCEGSASDKPGKCPVCKMDLERNPAAKASSTDSL